MTDKLTPQTQSDLINYRIDRAFETLEAANFLASGEYFNLAVERLYYACFYAASALMLANNLSAATHAGIKVLLNINFIKKGLLEPEYGSIYQSLFEKRQSGDYEDFVYCDRKMFDYFYPQANEFVEKIKSMLPEP